MSTRSLYENRLDASTYRQDVQSQLRLQPDPRDEGSETIEGWISERLLERPSVEDELAFLFGVVSDAVLLEAIAPLREMLRMAAHHPRGWSLVVETP